MFFSIAKDFLLEYSLFMSFLIPLFLCFSWFLIFSVIFVLTVPGMKIRYELWAGFLGLAAVMPVAFAEYFALGLPFFKITGFVSILTTAFVFYGLIEEFFKLVFMMLIPAKNLRLSVFFALCLVCGFAFGGFETVIYLLTFLQKNRGAGINGIFAFVLLRLVTSVPIHVFCAGLSGLCIWTFKAAKCRRNVMPFFLAVCMHGLYDFFAKYPSPFYYFIIPVILFAAINCRVYYMEFLGKGEKVNGSEKKVTDVSEKPL